jgi:hypothetical protein
MSTPFSGVSISTRFAEALQRRHNGVFWGEFVTILAMRLLGILIRRSTLRCAISSIIAFRSGPQMIRGNAGPHIATMANANSVRQ